MLENDAMYQPGPSAPRVSDAHNPAAIRFARMRLAQLKKRMPGLQLPGGMDPTAQWRAVSPLMGQLVRGEQPGQLAPMVQGAEEEDGDQMRAHALVALRQMLQQRQAPRLGQPSEALRRAAQMAAMRQMAHEDY